MSSIFGGSISTSADSSPKGKTSCRAIFCSGERNAVVTLILFHMATQIPTRARRRSCPPFAMSLPLRTLRNSSTFVVILAHHSGRVASDPHPLPQTHTENKRQMLCKMCDQTIHLSFWLRRGADAFYFSWREDTF
jgi:hypothetical protein